MTPIVPRPSDMQLAALSRCGSYVAVHNGGSSTVTITNLLSQTPSHIISAGPGMISNFALTGNILLVQNHHGLTAWRLTSPGRVLKFLVKRETVVIKNEFGDVIHVYHQGAGEVLDPVRAISHHSRSWLDLWQLNSGSHNLRIELQETGWVKDPEGKHRMWLPVEWRGREVGWSCDSKALRLDDYAGTVVIKF